MSASSTLVYDGDCGICQKWVNHWQQLTGDEVDYRPYQEVAESFPAISIESFQNSIQHIDEEGNVSSGAKATFLLYQYIFPYSLLILLYRYLPGFSFLAETAYRFFSRHRGVLSFVTRLFWGKQLQPSRYEQVTRYFYVLLGAIYLSAFFSFSIQAQGLIGSQGILPLHYYLDRLSEVFGAQAPLKAPMLFWFNSSNIAIQWVAILGCLMSVLIILNRVRTIALILVFILYLSLYHAGQTFMTFQWDIMLLEVGFLAIFLGSGSRIVVFLFRWLLFRFMLLGGLVKLASRDPSWDNLTALFYHFETQPLPTPFAYQAHFLPDWILMALVVITFIVELALPFFIVAPRRIRFIAAWCFILFQTGIILTGNYNFFNLLTLSICLFLFDDAALKSVMPRQWGNQAVTRSFHTCLTKSLLIRTTIALLLVFISTEKFWLFFKPAEARELTVFSRTLAPFNLANNYGPFAVMTTKRHEVVIVGSEDGVTWKEYLFRHKPDLLNKPLQWIIPHQPRLDWQMWFAALSSPDRQIWFKRLLYQCLSGEQAVLNLFEFNPFPESPPVYIRADFYRYSFVSPEERYKDGNIWKREYVGEFHPAIALKTNAR